MKAWPCQAWFQTLQEYKKVTCIHRSCENMGKTMENSSLTVLIKPPKSPKALIFRASSAASHLYSRTHSNIEWQMWAMLAVKTSDVLGKCIQVLQTRFTVPLGRSHNWRSALSVSVLKLWTLWSCQLPNQDLPHNTMLVQQGAHAHEDGEPRHGCPCPLVKLYMLYHHWKPMEPSQRQSYADKRMRSEQRRRDVYWENIMIF